MNRLRRCLCFSLLFIWSFYQIWRSLQLIRHSPEVEKVTMAHLLQRNVISQEKNGMIRYEQNRTETAESKKTTLPSFHYKSCSLSDTIDTSNVKTPFKIYIYDLPSAFNLDITQRLMKKDECYSLEYCGIGERLFDIGNNMFVHNTHQFSLEVVLHHKLLFSPYRTLDPDKANIFYIPAYIGLHCMEFSHTVGKLVDTLFQYLNGSEYFRMGKPHFSSVAKIEREMTTTNCPYFRRSETSKIAYFGIEKENAFISRYGHAISVPYPSYVHSSHEGRTLDIPDLDKRDVYVLLCAGQRRSNKYRAKIMDQIPNKTSLSYDKYVRSHTIQGQDIIMLFTNECSPGPAKNTIPWMRHSVFCLQPPGDSPTRKSLYDAILSGCIPVLFPYPNQSSVWAFNNVFNYSEFTVTIPYDTVTSRGQKVLDILKAIPREGIKQMHNKVKEVSQWFQYTSIDGNINSHTDAVHIILKELENIYKFQKTS